MGGIFKEYCVRGHLLSETRKTNKVGKYFCGECRVIYASEYNKKHRQRLSQNLWVFKLKTQFNMTPQDYTDVYIAQDGKCAICLNYIEYRGFATHIDHCHDKGNFRSLLCHGCNTAIGLFKENTEVMHRAIAYVDKHKNASINKE